MREVGSTPGSGAVREPRLAVDQAGGVLAAHGIALRIHRTHRLQHFDLVVANHLRVPQRGRLHRGERHHLDQVVLDHVAQRADPVVVAGAALDTERLGHGDLDLVDVRGAQHRLDEPVREPEHEDVLHRLLAEEVVDAEDLVLAPVLVQLLVERERAVEVGAERLLDHEPPVAVALVGEPRLGDGLRRVGEHSRRQREVEHRRTVEHVVQHAQ